MMNYLHFGIFLTILGIVSVAHADLPGYRRIPSFYNTFDSLPLGQLNFQKTRLVNLDENEDRAPQPNAFSAFSSPYFNHQLRPMKPMALLNRFPRNDDIENRFNSLGTALSNLSASSRIGLNIGETNFEKKIECCDNRLNCRVISEGEPCNGILRKHFSMQFGTQQRYPTSEDTSKSNKLNGSNSPVMPNENNPKPQKSTTGNIAQTPLDQLPENTSDEDDEVSPDTDELSTMPSSGMNETNQFLKNSAQSDKNGMSTQKKPSSSPDKKLMGTNGNTKMYYVMPETKPVQKHSYEKPTGLTDNEVKNIRKEVLEQTNLYREHHGIDPLTLNENMNNHAQEWANYLASKNQLRHRTDADNKIYGENLFSSSPMENIGEVAVNAWYNELRFVDVNDDEGQLENNPNGVTGHMTQLLWKKSQEMGVGVAKSENGSYVVVANYNPPGNVIPFFVDNLPTFTKEDIQAAQDAHDKFDKKMRTPKVTVMKQ